MKRKTRFLLFVITLALSFCFIKTTYADDSLIYIIAEIQAQLDNETSSGGSCTAGSGGPKYDCGIRNAGYTETLKLSESLYDTEGKYIGEALLIQKLPEYKFLSGRFVGIDAYEEYTRRYMVTINPSCTYVKVRCYKRTVHSGCYNGCECKSGVMHDPTCGEGSETIPGTSMCLKPYDYEVCYDYQESDTTCPAGYRLDTCFYPGCIPQSVASCRGQAESAVDDAIKNTDLTPSYEARRQDVNDINVGVTTTEPIEPTIKDIEPVGYKSVSKGLQPTENLDSKLVYKDVIMHYSYNLPKACIDAKTGKVTYVKIDVNCPDDSLEVPEITANINGSRVHVGQYFMPLNAKSDDLVRYYLYPRRNGSNPKKPMSVELCNNLLDKYGRAGLAVGIDWKEVAVDVRGNKFPDNISISDAKKKIKNDGGCYLSYLSAFRIDQKFYDDEPNEPIKGYKYYYRPIDYRKPFPNGLYSDSFWKGIYDENTNKVTVSIAGSNTTVTYNLYDSFSNITYETGDDYNTKNIQSYNELKGEDDDKRIYASWYGIGVNGVSNFINNYNYIQRRNCNSVYTLGCGPANADWAICKENLKTEVCD